MKRFSLIVGVTLLVAAVLFHVASGRPQVTVALVIRDDRVFMNSSIGEILLDTGAAISMMDEEVARLQKLHPTDEHATVNDLAGVVMPVEIAILDQLTIPAKEPSGLPWRVGRLNVALVRGLKEKFGFSFLLGMPAFQKTIVDLDLPRSELHLLKNLPFGFHCKRVPVREIEGVPVIPIYLDDAVPMQADIDTGC